MIIIKIKGKIFQFLADRVDTNIITQNNLVYRLGKLMAASSVEEVLQVTI